VFDSIAVKWRIGRIESSIKDKLDLLSSLNHDIVDEIERHYSSELNRILFVIERVGFVLAGIIAVVPFLIPAITAEIFGVPSPSTSPQLWFPALAAIFIILITATTTYLIQDREWARTLKRTNFD
jgi:hypothetical protein